MSHKNYSQIGIGTNVEIGKNGPRFKDTSGIVEFKNNADDAYIVVRAADPVADNDIVTLRYVRTQANVIVTGQIDGTSPPAAVNGAVYVVTTTGGVYTENELWYGEGGSWTAITLLDGMTMRTTTDLTGGNIEFTGDHNYQWDATGGTWVDIGPSTAEGKKAKNERVDLAFNSSSPLNVGTALPAGARVQWVKVNVTQAFNGTTESTLSVGDAVDTDRLMTIAEVDLSEVGLYVSTVNYTYSSSTQVIATYVQDSATTGTATIEVLYTTT